MKFIPVHEKEIHSGNIESVVTKEKAKFPQDFFPEVIRGLVLIFLLLDFVPLN